jgi:hypothetical protein
MLWPGPLAAATARRHLGRVPPVPAAAFAATLAWPTVLVAVAFVVAICLWGLLRRGSVADRARDDVAGPGPGTGADEDRAAPPESPPG